MKIAQRTHTGLPAQRTNGAAPHRARATRRRGLRVAAPLAAAIALGTVALAVFPGSSGGDAPTAGNIFTEAKAANASAEARLIVAGPAAALPIVDGDWRLDSVVVDRSWLTGTFAGTATLSYTGQAPTAGSAFSVGVYNGSAYLGRLTGTVRQLSSGGHAMVSLSSVDPYEAGQYNVGFVNAQ